MRCSEHPLYNTWHGMRRRCMKARHYTDISVYPPWDETISGNAKHSGWAPGFLRFIEWAEANLGPKPDGHTLDRIDPYGDYEPGNLRWADHYTQTHNRRTWHYTHPPEIIAKLSAAATKQHEAKRNSRHHNPSSPQLSP